MIDAAAYSTLEYDVDHGRRSKREIHVESLLTRLTGAEAAMVVTNNAAAVLLALAGLARRRNVIVSRSQLVEIGGGFRIPEVMQQSGARLVEVGTTNRTHLRDFEDALDEHTALVLVAHHSNFKIVGFSVEPSLRSLALLGERRGVPLLHDLGSGALLDTATYGLGHEPTVQESIQAGVSLVCFSGDKLLGGPQGGILVGQKSLIDRLKRHPLSRAVRPDKLGLAALRATLIHYLKDEAVREVPVWRMISMTQDAVRARAHSWRNALGAGEVMESRSTVGGGSLPEETLPTCVLALSVPRPERFLARLREADPPIVARVEHDRVLLDPRTVFEEQDVPLLHHLGLLLRESSPDPASFSSTNSSTTEEVHEV
jgi:L-seryl-tRNA(Ser) seleniumtransferase